VEPQEGTSPDLVAHASRLLLERALMFAPEAEVHWPAAGAATSGAEHDGGTCVPPSACPAAPAGTEPSAGTAPSAGTVSRVAVDLAAGQVLLDGRPVPLTGVEYRVLRYLVENCSRAVGRDELQQYLDSFESPGASTRAIDVYVGRVRRKLGNARHAVATVRGGGYRFMPDARATVRGPAEYCI